MGRVGVGGRREVRREEGGEGKGGCRREERGEEGGGRREGRGRVGEGGRREGGGGRVGGKEEMREKVGRREFGREEGML